MLRKLAFGVFLLLTGLSIIFAFRDDKSVTTKSPEAYKHYLAGVDLTDKFYFRQAAKEFEQAVALDSGFAMAEARLARAYGDLGFKEKGKDMWEVALKNKPNVSDREQLLLDMWKAETGDNRALTDSLAYEYVAKYPRYLEGYVDLASHEFARENWEKSIEFNQKALTIDPNYAQAYNMLGYLNYYLGRYDVALSMLEKYIQLCPNQANPHDSRGEILLAIGRYDEALGEFREAFNINPELDFPVLHMAATYDVLGEFKQVDYCFQILDGQAPSDFMKLGYQIQKARLYIDARKYETATEILERVIREDADPERQNASAAVAAKGYLAYVRRDLPALKIAWEERRRYVKDLLEKRPVLAEQSGTKRTFTFMGATESDLAGDLATAATQFAELIDSTRTPSEKVAFRIMYADVLWRGGNVDQAMSELQKNLSVNSNQPRSLLLLANISEAQGDKQAALGYRQQVLAIWKNADADFQPLAELQKKVNLTVALSPKAATTKP
jgi:tetratricopeptide (TPR) repeat protein